MRLSDSLANLLDYGVLDEVVRPLMSGKEAQVYLVISEGEERVAKFYKEAQNRTFQSRAEYTEGRQVRNSRDQRAMAKRSRYGKAKDEAAWRSTEVDMIYRLREAGVRVPTPHHFIDGVLIMELVRGADGGPAPRLGDLEFSRDEANHIFEQLLVEATRMLCAGVVHGDLSDFNVLMAADGPVLIDFPQAVSAASNQNARKLLLRDIDNLHRFAERFAPGRRSLPYAQEMWQLYERGELAPNTRLTGHFSGPSGRADTQAVLGVIADAQYDARQRRPQNGGGHRGVAPPRVEYVRPPTQGPGQGYPPRPQGAQAQAPHQGPRGHSNQGGFSGPSPPQGQRPPPHQQQAPGAPGSQRRRRRRRRRGGGPPQGAPH